MAGGGRSGPARVPVATPRWVDAAAAGAIFAAGVALYLATLAPGLSYPAGDSHAFTTSSATLGLARRTGYPLYTWLGFLFTRGLPVGDLAYRTNLLSAVGAAGGGAVVFLIARRLDLGRGAAAFAALLLLTSTTLWSQAVVTEVYGPNAFMLALVLWSLLAWAARVERGHDAPGALALAGLLFGLSLGTHLSNLTLAPAFGLFVLLVDPRTARRPRTLGLAAGACLLGVAQFLWLPLRAATAIFPNPVPSTPAGVWEYTLGAFDHLRFAFPLGALPARLAYYGGQLVENVTAAGVVAGMLGAWVLMWRRPAACCLLLATYVLNVATATQVAVGDADRFFIPGYVVWVLFAGGGVQALSDVVRRRGPRGALPSRLAAATVWMLALAVLLPAARTSFADNDRRGDTVADDFYRGAMDVLPPGTALVAPPGVFGQAARYWAEIEGLRPDVRLPDGVGQAGVPPGAPSFTTIPTRRGRVLAGMARGRVSRRRWFVPVLLGGRHDLVLYRVDDEPPAFTASVPVAARLDRRLGAATLVAAAVEPLGGGPVRRVGLRTWWRFGPGGVPVVSTRVGDVTVEAHEVGFGNVGRAAVEAGLAPDAIIAEDLQVVLPSTLAPGRHPVRVGVVDFTDTGVRVAWAEVGRVDID
jgi:hypothetical protein